MHTRFSDAEHRLLCKNQEIQPILPVGETETNNENNGKSVPENTVDALRAERRALRASVDARAFENAYKRVSSEVQDAPGTWVRIMNNKPDPLSFKNGTFYTYSEKTREFTKFDEAKNEWVATDLPRGLAVPQHLAEARQREAAVAQEKYEQAWERAKAKPNAWHEANDGTGYAYCIMTKGGTRGKFAFNRTDGKLFQLLTPASVWKPRAWPLGSDVPLPKGMVRAANGRDVVEDPKYARTVERKNQRTSSSNS